MKLARRKLGPEFPAPQRTTLDSSGPRNPRKLPGSLGAFFLGIHPRTLVPGIPFATPSRSLSTTADRPLQLDELLGRYYLPGWLDGTRAHSSLLTQHESGGMPGTPPAHPCGSTAKGDKVCVR